MLATNASLLSSILYTIYEFIYTAFCTQYTIAFYTHTFRLFAIIKDLGKRRRSGSGAIVWQEVIDNDVKVGRLVTLPV